MIVRIRIITMKVICFMICVGPEKYHIVELGAGDYSKSVSLASRFAYAFDSLSVYDAFDYTSTELADVPENRLIQKNFTLLNKVILVLVVVVIV